MKYHIKLLSRIDDGEYKINLSEEELIARYVEPYIYGETIVINGTTVDPLNLWRIKIFESEDNIDQLIAEIENRDQLDRNPYKFLKGAPAWRAIDQQREVTDNFIKVPPGSQTRQNLHLKEKEMKSQNNKNIFIVHGHDTELKNDVELFLKSIDLNPIVLHRELDEGLTVIEKFEKHSDVNYAIILLTPDDIGFTVEESQKHESEREIELRARQNVIFEFGYFVGKLTRRNVCCIYKEGVKLPSDLNGLIYKKVNKSIEEVGLFLMKELRNCGLDVKF